jgi:hypothetical protein
VAARPSLEPLKLPSPLQERLKWLMSETSLRKPLEPKASTLQRLYQAYAVPGNQLSVRPRLLTRNRPLGVSRRKKRRSDAVSTFFHLSGPLQKGIKTRVDGMSLSSEECHGNCSSWSLVSILYTTHSISSQHYTRKQLLTQSSSSQKLKLSTRALERSHRPTQRLSITIVLQPIPARQASISCH